jgi:hypothetical protein
MKEIINSRLFSACLITFGLPAMLYLVAVQRSQVIANSITAGIGEAVAEMAKGEKKKNVQDIVSGFTTQLIEGLKAPFAEMQTEQRQEKFKQLELLDNIVVSAVKQVPSDWGGSKVIGTITNNSNENIEGIHLSFSTYDEGGNLLNVGSEWASDIKVIKAKESVNFGVSPSILRPAKDVPYVAPTKVEVKISDFKILKQEGAKKAPPSAS